MPQEVNMNQQMSQGMAPTPPKKESAAAPADSQAMLQVIWIKCLI